MFSMIYIILLYNIDDYYSHLFAEVCENGDVRLTSTVVQYEGRVEICFEETWGAVCDSDWTVSDAQVTCKQLLYQGICVHHNCILV